MQIDDTLLYSFLHFIKMLIFAMPDECALQFLMMVVANPRKIFDGQELLIEIIGCK